MFSSLPGADGSWSTVAVACAGVVGVTLVVVVSAAQQVVVSLVLVNL